MLKRVIIRFLTIKFGCAWYFTPKSRFLAFQFPFPSLFVPCGVRICKLLRLYTLHNTLWCKPYKTRIHVMKKVSIYYLYFSTSEAVILWCRNVLFFGLYSWETVGAYLKAGSVRRTLGSQFPGLSLDFATVQRNPTSAAVIAHHVRACAPTPNVQYRTVENKGEHYKKIMHQRTSHFRDFE